MSTVTPPRPTPPRPTPTPPRSGGAPAVSVDPFRVLRRHWVAITAAGIFGILVGVGAHVAFNMFMPQYSANVRFEVLGAMESPSDILSKTDYKTDTVERIARTELALIMSDQVLRLVVNNPQVRNSTQWAKGFTDESGGYQIGDAIDELMEDLRPSYLTDTNLFEVSWSTTKDTDLKPVLDTLAATYLAERRKVDEATWNADNAAFTSQRQDLQLRIDALQRDIDAFIRSHNIFTLDDIRYHPLAREIEEINMSLAEARKAVSLLRSSYDQTQAKLVGEIEPTAEDILMAEQDRTLSISAQRLVDLRAERRALGETLNQDHRAMQDIERRVRAVEEEFESQRRRIIERNLTAQLKQLGYQIESYANMIRELEGRLATKDAAFNELAAKVSEYQTKLLQRDNLQTQLQDIEALLLDAERLRTRNSSTRIRLATSAETPREKSFPRPEIIVPLGFLLVVGLTVGFIFLRELTDTRVKSASDLAVVPGAQVMGVIPDVSDDPTKIGRAELAVRNSPRSVIAESYRQMATPILKRMDRAGHQTLVVTAGMPGAGATTVVSNLAATIAAGGRSVLVIDANFRRPSLAKVFGESNDRAGLGDVLVGSTSFDEATVNCDGISLITAGTPGNRLFERLANGEFDRLLADARPKYDYVLIDAPPAVVAGDALVVANHADATLIVIRANQEQRGLVARLISQFNEAKGELLGVVLNRPRETAGGYFKKNFATMADYASKSKA